MSDVIESSSSGFSKRVHGQFFTTTNPFNVDPFHKWLKAIPDYRNSTVLEPFAGANNIVCMLSDLGYELPWKCYDIDPVTGESNASGLEVLRQNTLTHYPDVPHTLAITNPPYLASYSARRLGLPFPANISHDNVYKEALDVMLRHTPFVAAIIPESFITQNLFHSRLHAVISLTCRMFEDTEMPVCLALFVPESSKVDVNDFRVYAENRFLGNFVDLKALLEPYQGPGLPWKFNDPCGAIGLRAVDSQKGPSIAFVPGVEITSLIQASSRLITRISAPLADDLLERVIGEANQLLKNRRAKTKDTFMTAFKGLRADGCYRRRLDFAQARDLLNLAAQNVGAL